MAEALPAENNPGAASSNSGITPRESPLGREKFLALRGSLGDAVDLQHLSIELT
ncbi:MAG: hypothetical protein QOD75_2647 [Blastocatellia bacterium]|nr:hypothetical protein [Blastocatellia bacterium]